ncbi:EamA family transporter [Candidatus Fermentibacteria bacterium]|nr:EamA family transporter [Candidatus Fermentibacteria bacterium]
MDRRAKARLHLGLATLFWGLTFVVIRPLVAVVPPLPLVLLRFAVATLVVGGLLAARRLRLSRTVRRRGALMGLVLFGGYFLQTAGLQFTGAGKCAFITALYVVLTPLIVWPVMGRRPVRTEFMAAFLALAGMYLLSNPSSRLNPGDLLTLGSAFCWAIHLALIDRLHLPGKELELCFVQLAVVTVVSLPLALVSGVPARAFDLRPVLGLLYLALPATALVVLWQFRWQPHLGAPSSALIYVGEAVVASTGGVILFGESLPWFGWLGGAMILASTGWSVYASRRSESAAGVRPKEIMEASGRRRSGSE